MVFVIAAGGTLCWFRGASAESMAAFLSARSAYAEHGLMNRPIVARARREECR